ncbi:MAG: dihydropteroate synthase, partial [Deltaproteobacteria bacterium]|nr:dihydropteroate synthase [Deltaproteobacteria bacterium]
MREAKKVFLLRNFENENIAKILGRLGVHPVGIDIMRKKFRFCVFYITGLTSAECNILKQEALSCGAEAAVPKGSVECKVKSGDVLLSGTEKELRLLSQKLLLEPFFLKEIGKEIENVLSENRRPVFRISGEKILTTDKHPLIMGILNTTPDSFSDGGKYLNTDEAIRHGIRLSEEGADIIDIGGESTRPGSKGVSAKEEMMRVIPVIKSLAKKIKTPISIDTTKSEVAKAALDNGASIINDISGLVFDRNIGKVAARYNSGLILMHTRGRPNTMQRGEISYTNLLLD